MLIFLGRLLPAARYEDLGGQINSAFGRVRTEGFSDLTF